MVIKNLSNWNMLKKFMQVGSDVTCMHTNFGRRVLSGFGDKNNLYSIVVKNLLQWNRLKKFMQSLMRMLIAIHVCTRSPN